MLRAELHAFIGGLGAEHDVSQNSIDGWVIRRFAIL